MLLTFDLKMINLRTKADKFFVVTGRVFSVNNIYINEPFHVCHWEDNICPSLIILMCKNRTTASCFFIVVLLVCELQIGFQDVAFMSY